MLLPALGKAREKARTISCTNQAKQHALAVAMYLGDNNDFFPIASATYYGASAVRSWAAVMLGENYIQPNTFLCPAATQYAYRNEIRTTSTSTIKGDNSLWWLNWVDYGINRWISTSTTSSAPEGDGKVSQSIGAVIAPGKTVMLADSGYMTASADTMGTNPYRGIFYINGKYSDAYRICDRHGDSASVAFVDGHVENIKNACKTLHKASDGSTPTADKELIHFYPNPTLK